MSAGREPVHIYCLGESIEYTYTTLKNCVLCGDLLKSVSPQEVLWRLKMTVQPPFPAPAPATAAAPSPMSQYTSTETYVEYMCYLDTQTLARRSFILM